MRKHPSARRKLYLAKETIRNILSPELRAVAGGFSCGADTACDCSGTGGNDGTTYCTRIQP
jgi:hypothetical protein